MSVDVCLHVRRDDLSREDVAYFNFPAHAGNDQRYWDLGPRVAQCERLVLCDGDMAPDDEAVDDLSILFRQPVELTEEVYQRLLEYGKRLHIREEIEAFLRPHMGKDVFIVSW